MKKYFFAFFPFLFFNQCYSQVDQTLHNKWAIGIHFNAIDHSPLGDFYGFQDYYSPYTYKLENSIKVNTFSVGLCITEFNNNSSNGVRFGITSFRISTHDKADYPTQKYEDFLNGKQNLLYLEPIKYWFIDAEKIRFKGGFYIPFCFYGKYSEESEIITNDLSTSTITTAYDNGIARGGFSFGTGLSLGFDLVISKKIIIGGDFSSDLEYVNVGGKSSHEIKIFDASNNLISDYTSTSNQTVEHFGAGQAKGIISCTFLIK